MKAFYSILMLLSAGMCYAQDCKNFYYMINNAEVQMTLFDKSGSKSGIQTWKISDVKNEGMGFRSTILATIVDSKGRELGRGSGHFQCDGGKLMTDMRLSLPHDENQPYSEVEAKTGNAFIEYPTNLSEGMMLPDAFFEMNMNTNGMPTAAAFEMKNRKVVGREKVSSEAGSWDAFKITYDATMKVKVAGIGIPVRIKTTEWFVPDFGIVKTESVSRNGKVASSSLLTSLKK